MKNKIIILTFLLAFLHVSFIIVNLEWQNLNLSENETSNNQKNRVAYPRKSSSTPLWTGKGSGNSVAISSDGKYIVTGSDNQYVRLFEKSSSTPLWSNLTGYYVRSVDISSNGEYIVAGNWDQKVYLFHKSSSNPLWTANIGDCDCVAISADGNYITAGTHASIYLFDKSSSVPLWGYGTGWVNDIAISADGNYIVVGSRDNNVYVFNRSSPGSKILWSYTTSGPVQSVAISSDGNYIVAGSENDRVYFFNISDSNPKWSDIMGYDVLSVDLSSDGNNIVIGSGFEVYFYNKSSSTPLWSYSTDSAVSSVSISADGDYMAWTTSSISTEGKPQNVYLYQINESTLLGSYAMGYSYDHPFVAISSNGSYIAVCGSQGVYLFHKSGFNDYIDENDIEINLEQSGTETGDKDDDIDAGEKWCISIKIKNLEHRIASYVKVFLDSDDSYISFSDKEKDRKKECSPDSIVEWDFTISLEIPSNYEIELTITITDSSGYVKVIEEKVTVVEGDPYANTDWAIVGITLLIILGIIGIIVVSFLVNSRKKDYIRKKPFYNKKMQEKEKKTPDQWTKYHRDWKDIPISSDFKYYSGRYSNRYVSDESAVEKEIEKLPKILGQGFSQFFKINIKKKSDKYILLHLTGENKFISKSVLGDYEYTAFTVNRSLKTRISSFQNYEIEGEKNKIIKKEVLNWNGRTHYYTSPTGRRISRILRTSRNDFNVTVDKLLEQTRPEKMIVSSNLAPNVQQNVLGITKNKMCVKCGNIFKPIKWRGWSKKYISIFNVYNCEKCNLKLGEQITEEKIIRKEIRFKILKFSIIPFINTILLLTFFMLNMPFFIFMGIPLLLLSIFLLFKYVKELIRRKKVYGSIIPFQTEEEISKLERKIIQNLSKFTYKPKELNQLESDVKRLVNLEIIAKKKADDRSSENFKEQLNNIKQLLYEKKDTLEKKLRLIIPKVNEFLSLPVKKKGQELKIELVSHIGLCKKNDLKDLYKHLNELLIDIESLLKEMQEIESEFINYEKAFGRSEYGFIIGTIDTFENKILKKNFSEFFERLSDLIKRSNSGLKENYSQIINNMHKVEDYLEHHNFNEAKKFLISSKEIAKSLRLDYLKEEKYAINFDKKLDQINRLEKNFIIHQALLKFSKKYTRITLKELSDSVEIGTEEVMKTVKRFIKDKLIPAHYDNASNGIEFKGVMDKFISAYYDDDLMEEIDNLLKSFEEWNKNDKNKKKQIKIYPMIEKEKKEKEELSYEKKLMKILSDEWHSLEEICSKMNINDKMDVRFFKVKLKRFENKGLVKMKIISGENKWKKN